MKSLPSRERGLKCNGNKRGINKNLSLPSRERGLKYLHSAARSAANRSLPSRERGLKWQQKDGKCDRMVSLPSRERGLKFICSLSFISCGLYVAPLAGAWIEISDCEPDVFCVSSRSPRGSVD